MLKQNHNVFIIIAIFILLLLNIPIALYIYSQSNNKADILTNTEIYLLNPLLPTASEEKKTEYNNAVERNRQRGDTLYIGQNCKMFPLVLEAKAFTELTIKNTDTRIHTIKFTEKLVYRVQPSKQVTIFTNFPNGPGTYGYTCDKPKSTSRSGIVVIKE